ncbi:recombinase family protein [Sedimentimonas flavescens]|uniref:Recombinase family protein n=1 Tax=Sedimentimonas flavescens TaxID=2851012 RepID=A0ABT3A305_9RHOB|nr:recombinase family protein [Sedimentimonas flavescens]MCV2880387.1 recombinase family protein [Sedimentimonas flavescens]
MTRRTIRCAIYTRKSSEDGLEQDFNSLDAQREACEAYVASQRHEGWKPLPARYDDGGISGGTLERPGLQRLLADIDAGRVEMVVVYKIDRLTRSLADFAKLVERLEAAGCSFVSVTQAFNTSSSMGRLTLNVLLSFAQFEREVTAERIRDKIAASKNKGLWMGGLAPLGYDPHPDKTRRELVVNEREADTVRSLFDLYLQHGCLNATVRAAEATGLRSKLRSYDDGRQTGGRPFTRGQIHHLLTNPVYRGLIRHKSRCWPAAHPAIIDAATWDAVQERLQQAARRRRGARGTSLASNLSEVAAPLLGKIRDERGDLLTPSHTQRHGRRYRYYVSNRLISGGPDPTGWRLPAEAFEHAVTTAVVCDIRESAQAHTLSTTGAITEITALAARGQTLAQALEADSVRAMMLIERIDLGSGSMQIALAPEILAREIGARVEDLDPSALSISTTFAPRRRGVEMKIVTGANRTEPDPKLLAALRKAHHWARQLRSGLSLKDLAARAGTSERYAARVIPLATLSPKIQGAILKGEQPVELTLESLLRITLPLDWKEQEHLLGIHA